MLWKEGYFASLSANVLHFISVSYYFYITFRGYAGKANDHSKSLVLPCLRKTEYFLVPIALAAVWFLLLSLLGINSTRLFLDYLAS